MKNVIAKKEFTQTLRDSRFWIFAALILILLLTASLVGFQSYQNLKAEREVSTKEAREIWLKQGEKNPHSAAHFGTFAFRPKSELSFMDFGIDSFVGSSVYMEAHRQNDVKFSAAQESGSIIRFGEMTVAFVLQFLLPLLIVFLCFNTFTQEKEENTLKILLSQGISLSQVAWGKIFGFTQIVILIALPAFLMSFIFLIIGTDGNLTSTLISRFILVVLFYSAYYFIILGSTILVSAYAATSRNALLTMLSAWILLCIVLPKATSNLGATVFNAPSNFEFKEAIKKDEANGIDGHNSSDKRFDALQKSLLTKYKVDSVSKLPVNFDAIAMQEGEKYTSMVYSKHFDTLQNIYSNQNAVAQWASLANPFLAVRSISMGLSGSDYQTVIGFQEQAESYRYKMVEKLNGEMAKKSKTGDWEWKAKADFWNQVPDFEYVSPKLSTVFRNNILPILSMLLWVFGITFFINKKLTIKKLF